MTASGFPPIEREDAVVLVLGTGPSIVSLRKQEYYGHPTNAFWPIMERLFATPCATYEAKRNLLVAHRVALWDTLASFEREGSSDSGYRSVVPNDLKPFILAHPDLRAVCFTGQKAAWFYRRYIDFRPEGLEFTTLPSPSAANTTPFAVKYAAYAACFAKYLTTTTA